MIKNDLKTNYRLVDCLKLFLMIFKRKYCSVIFHSKHLSMPQWVYLTIMYTYKYIYATIYSILYCPSSISVYNGNTRYFNKLNF